MKLYFQIIALSIAILISSTKEFSYSSQGSWDSYCSSGDNQSPIVLELSAVDASSLDYYQLLITNLQNHKDATIINDGTTIFSEGNWIEFTVSDINKKPRSYETEVVKFHSPAEHKIDSFQPDLEIQFIAKQKSGFSDSKTHGILSLLFVEAAGDDNEILTGFSNYIETQTSEGSQFQNINLYDALFPLLSHYNASLEYYTYQGSFTTPPCAETVNWYIIKNYFPVSSKQLAQFRSLWSGNLEFAERSGNNRNLQPLNERKIVLGKAYVDKLSGFILNAAIIFFAFSLFILLL